jgi:hypothetical protein
VKIKVSEIDKVAEFLGGKAGEDHGKPRIYFDLSRKDAKAWLDFSDDFDGKNLNVGKIDVRVEDSGQSAKRHPSESFKIQMSLAHKAFAFKALRLGDEEAAKRFLATPLDYEEEATHKIAKHLFSGRLGEALKIVEELNQEQMQNHR